MGSHYVFQESHIWDGSGDAPDKTREPKRIKATSLARAKKRLPFPSLGRRWILIETIKKEENQT